VHFTALFKDARAREILKADYLLSDSLSSSGSRVCLLAFFLCSLAFLHLMAEAYRLRTCFLDDFFAIRLSSLQKSLLEKCFNLACLFPMLALQALYIAMGIHAGDFSIYPDCRAEFRDADDVAFRLGNWGAEKVGYFTPYIDGMKFDILKDGEVLCEELGLDFNEVYKRTNTSYKPIYHELAYEDGMDIVDASGWFSDYKSASSVERVEAFIKLGRPDPAPYADEEGPVTWNHVVKEVSKVLAENGK